MRRLVFCLLSVCVWRAAASAHVLDQYLQIAQIALRPDGAQIELRLTPGVGVAQNIIALMDTNGDGLLTDAEKRAYAERVRQDLILKINSQPRPLRLTATDFPSLQAMREGVGAIRLTFLSETDLTQNGSQQLEFQNHHLPQTSVYLANALVPSSDTITVQQQRRDATQCELRIDFRVAAAASPIKRWMMSLWVLLSLAILLAGKPIARFVFHLMAQKSLPEERAEVSQ